MIEFYLIINRSGGRATFNPWEAPEDLVAKLLDWKEEIIMSERLQHTAASTREKMLQRYGDVFHHKHDKNHNLYRQHCRSHPAKTHYPGSNEEAESQASTGLVREFNLRKCRKQLGKGQIH
jgi:hypothetical protein